MSERTTPIRVELIAAKIEQIENFEQSELSEEIAANPRFISTLLTLEHFSRPEHYAGGLTKFSHDLIERYADRIGTATMAKLGQVELYSPSEALAILRKLTQFQREELFGDDFWLFENAFTYRDPGVGTLRVERKRARWLLDDDEARFDHEYWSGTRAELEQLLIDRLTPATARKICLAEAQSGLAGYFKRLCEQPQIGLRPNDEGKGAPNYFSRIGPTLLEFIDQRAAVLRGMLAETEVSQLVFRWMAKARTMKEPVMISGNSRFGKTEAAKTRCEMEPGRYRLVNTPASNSIGDLLREVAESLGIEVGPQNNLRQLRERIDYVLRFASLVLVFDEFHFIFPTAFSRNSNPPRLNWVRRSVVDKKIAAVFIYTPQDYQRASKAFQRVTKFAIEQFDGRVAATAYLPENLSEADLFAVARVHFSDLSESTLQFVVDEALNREKNYISGVAHIAKLAWDNARENGRSRPLLCDIKEAIGMRYPQAPASTTGDSKIASKKGGSSRVPQDVCKPVATRPQISPATLPESRRGMIQLAVKT